MTTHNTAGRSLAIAAGVVLASGTLGILFEDVLMHGAPITLKHWLTLVTVTGTMMVGHLADLARRQRHWMSVAGFTALFLAGTGLVVYSSVGRQAEKTMISSVEHDELVRQRLDLDGQIASERAALSAKRRDADTECASGEGNRCKAKRATAEYYENSLKGLEARLQLLEPAKPVSVEAEQFATVAAALGYDKDQVRALAILLAPFFTTLFLEFGTIVSFGFAFSPKRKLIKLPATDGKPLLPKPVETAQTSFDGNGFEARFFQEDLEEDIEPKGGNGGRKVFNRVEAERDLVTRLALGETVASQDELAVRWGVDKSTVSKWLKRWEGEDLIPARTQIGRCKTLASAN